MLFEEEEEEEELAMEDCFPVEIRFPFPDRWVLPSLLLPFPLLLPLTGLLLSKLRAWLLEIAADEDDVDNFEGGEEPKRDRTLEMVIGERAEPDLLLVLLMLVALLLLLFSFDGRPTKGDDMKPEKEVDDDDEGAEMRFCGSVGWVPTFSITTTFPFSPFRGTSFPLTNCNST